MKTAKKEKSATHPFSIIALFRDIALILGVISSLIGFGPQIIDSFEKIIDTFRKHALISTYQQYGKNLFKSESYKESTYAFEEALRLQPHDLNTQVWLKKAQLLDALNKLKEIDPQNIPDLSFKVEFVIQSDPTDDFLYRYYYVQGNIRYVLKNLDGARQSYETALQKKSNYGPALANLGGVLNELKHHQKAVLSLRKALSAGYAEAVVYNNLVFALYSSGKVQEAVSVANEGLQRFPTAAGIYNELAIALYKLGRKEESVAALKTACVMTPETDTDSIVQRLINLAYPLADLGNIDEALSFLESAKHKSPQNPQVYLALAHCYRQAGDDAKAIAAYEKIGSLGAVPDPDDLLIWARLLKRARRTGEAVRILHIAVDTWNGEKELMGQIATLAKALNDQQLLKRIDAKVHPENQTHR